MTDTRLGGSLDAERLRRLLDVGRALVSEQDVEAVLARVLEVARELTDAKYAAIGVLHPNGHDLERFITSGIDESTKQRIGALPRGRGVLGVLIDQPHSLRLSEVGTHAKSYGFPPGHPPMSTFLGVPIRLRGDVYGNLYLTEKDVGDFTDEDEEAIGVLADWAAIAIDNARSYRGEFDRRRELEQAVGRLEATIDIIRALGGETDLERVLELIAKRARAVVNAKLLTILLLDDNRQTLTVVSMAGNGNTALIGMQVPAAESVSGTVMASGKPARIQRIRERMYKPMADLIDAEAGLAMPLIYRGQPLGVLIAFDRYDGEFTLDDESLLDSFSAGAAIAVATAQRVIEQVLRRSIETSERERERWARELHDETLQDLAALKVLLSTVRETDLRPLGEAIEQIEVSITGLRHLITELRPAALADYGLGAAVDALVQRVSRASGVDVQLKASLLYESGDATTRHEADVEGTMYRLVQEALTNAIRHANPNTVVVTIEEGQDDVFIEVRDDGAGFDTEEATEGFGLAGMRERVDLVHGEIEVTSVPGRGTKVTARVPATRRSAG